MSTSSVLGEYIERRSAATNNPMGMARIPNGARCTLHLDVVRAPRSQLTPHIARPHHRPTPRTRTLTSSSGRLAAGVAAASASRPVSRRAGIPGRTTAARKNGASDRPSQLAGSRRCHTSVLNSPLAHCNAFTTGIAIVPNPVPCPLKFTPFRREEGTWLAYHFRWPVLFDLENETFYFGKNKDN